LGGIGTWLQEEKKTKGEKKMRQTELAQRLGISKSYLSMILNGQRTPNSELAGRLSSLGFVNFEA